MIQNITTYYIPQNPNITKGKIYNIYLNKVTNLDLTSLIEKNTKTMNSILETDKNLSSTNHSTNSIPLTEEDYTDIMKLADTTTELYKQSQELVKKLSKGRILK